MAYEFWALTTTGVGITRGGVVRAGGGGGAGDGNLTIAAGQGNMAIAESGSDLIAIAAGQGNTAHVGNGFDHTAMPPGRATAPESRMDSLAAPRLPPARGARPKRRQHQVCNRTPATVSHERHRRTGVDVLVGEEKVAMGAPQVTVQACRPKVDAIDRLPGKLVLT